MAANANILSKHRKHLKNPTTTLEEATDTPFPREYPLMTPFSSTEELHPICPQDAPNVPIYKASLSVVPDNLSAAPEEERVQATMSPRENSSLVTYSPEEDLVAVVTPL